MVWALGKLEISRSFLFQLDVAGNFVGLGNYDKCDDGYLTAILLTSSARPY
jgi:hypothetical protein